MQLAVSKVIVVFKTHLDIGFTDFARNIVRKYLDHDVPAALALAKKTRNSPHRFVWTAGSWVVYRFLEDARPKQRRLMEEAIEAGDFQWHALPFTTHTELEDPSLFRLGLRFSEILDQRFGRKTIAAKMTDVPGHTKGIVPLLAARGIRLLHIGVNPASTPPEVPPIFVWKVGKAELVVIYEKVYGATTVLPGGAALSMNLTGDNLGPQNPSEIDKVYAALEKDFPTARIAAGGFNDVADLLWKQRKSLPVVTDEIGDTWIHGPGSDPAKIAGFRTLNRLRAEWIAAGSLQEGGPEDLAFGEKLLLIAEHTWGMDIKTHLGDERVFSQAGLRSSLEKPDFRKVAASWQEQRDYLAQALKALAAPRRKEAKLRLAEIQPVPPAKKSSPSLPLDQKVRLGKWELALDPLDGSLCFLRKAGERLMLADARHRLASFGYQTFSAADYERFYRQYNTLDLEWAQKDFMRAGLPASELAAWYAPRLRRLTTDGEVLRAELGFSPEARRYGAPAQTVLSITPQATGLDLRLEWFGKPANRRPEAFWLKFAPRQRPGAPFTLGKLGLPIDPRQVVRKGNRHLHAVTGSVEVNGLSIQALDSLLVAPGKPSLLDFNQTLPNSRDGVSFNLYNNCFPTNFPLWYADDALFRFQLTWK